VALFQAKVLPPYCRARRSWIVAAAKMAKPRRSRREGRVRRTVRGGGLGTRSGIVERRRRGATMAPTGRLM
jgi:hypothetical protein